MLVVTLVSKCEFRNGTLWSKLFLNLRVFLFSSCVVGEYLPAIRS
jgi:hypothetical protein